MSTQQNTASVAMPTTMRSARGLAHRGIRNIRRLPSAFFPAMAMPVFTMIAFAGTFAAITRLPGFPTDRSVNWFMPLGICFGAAFSGMSPAPRRSLIIGPLLTAWTRVAILCAFVIPMGMLLGVRFTSGLLGLLTLVVAAVGVSTISLGWGLGLAYRFRDMRGAAVMQLTMFVVLYLSTAQMPLPLMSGWLHNVARFNPATNILRLAREGLVLKTSPDYMSWSNTWGGLLAIVGMATLTLVFARRGLNKLDK